MTNARCSILLWSKKDHGILARQIARTLMFKTLNACSDNSLFKRLALIQLLTSDPPWLHEFVNSSKHTVTIALMPAPILEMTNIWLPFEGQEITSLCLYYFKFSEARYLAIRGTLTSISASIVGSMILKMTYFHYHQPPMIQKRSQ